MNYLYTPYNDYFYNERCNAWGDIKNARDSVYNKTEKNTVPGYDVFSKLLKTTCSLHPHDKSIQQYELLSLILLHYKCITAEQYNDLMPWAGPRLLSKHSNNTRKSADDSENKRKKGNKKKEILLNAYPYDGTSVYHCAYSKAVKSMKERAPDHAKHKTYRHSLAKLKYFMAQKDCHDIGMAWFQLLAEECRSDITSNELLSIRSLKEFIEDYMHANPGRPANDGSYEDVEAFVMSVETDEKYGRSSFIYRNEKAHTDKIRSDAWNFLLSDDGWYLREAVLKKRLSYVVVNRIIFDRYAPVMLTKESHYEEILFKCLEYTSLFNYCETGITEEEHGEINGFYFKNIFFFHDNDIHLTAFEEISQDLGGYARAKFFCDNYKGGGVPINLILLVCSDDDALNFSKKTKVERFVTWNPNKPSLAFKVHVAFVNYASKKALPFIYYDDDGKWVKRELIKQEPKEKEEC